LAQPTLICQLLPILRSPATGEALQPDGNQLRSVGGAETFPVVNGIPVLIDDGRSAFSTQAFINPPTARSRLSATLRRLSKAVVPDLTRNFVAADNYRRLLAELNRSEDAPKLVLVIGGATAGEGFEVLIDDPALTLVETDVAYGPRTRLICDAHSLPFADGSFHAVVCQAVLEHVADPSQVVAEIHRVLRPNGLVYSEIPFMQQVHEGAHDFTRYTLIGHRRLFKRFECLRVGATAGPATALAWSLKYLLLTLVGSSPVLRTLVTVIANCLLFWLKYADYVLLRLPSAADAASCTFLLGRRSELSISDRDLVTAAGADPAGFRLQRG
jgi:SAM-dependent methyltransferase